MSPSADSYPVLDVLAPLLERLAHGGITMLRAPTGAGKSTILPIHLLKESWLSGKKILMLEPRRLAAKSVAERMSALMNTETGQTIGYRVRFETKVSQQTKIEVVTEGILTRMLQSDNALEEIGLVIFDEFHERSLQADLALALTLQTQDVLRDDLRILIMSATLDAEALASLKRNIPVITSEGRQFPVMVRYEHQPFDGPIVPKMNQAIHKVIREEKGDILAFLPGAGEIRRTQQLLEEASIDAIICPLFGDLPFRQQQEAILPRQDGRRKIVLATSIAETSLTIEGIGVVIDGGLTRVPRFDPRSGLTRLETVRVSLDSADQRKGRAGRLGPGVCYRLWTEGVQRNLVPQRKPEILEADLSSMILELANWGIRKTEELTWVTAPPAGAANQATELLIQLGALDDSGITPRGREMVQLPTHPRISHLLLEASSHDEKSLACDMAALLEERDPLPKETGADLRLRIELLRRWRSGERTSADRTLLERVERLAGNWRKLLKVSAVNIAPGADQPGKLLIHAYPERIARQQHRQGLVYTLANGRVAKLPDHDPLLHEPWICAAQLDSGTREGRIFLATPVDEQDLLSMASNHLSVHWDDERAMVVAAMEKRVGGVLLQSRQLREIDEDEKNRVLKTFIGDKGLSVLNWNERAISLQARLQSLKIWRPTESWPDVSEEKLLMTLDEWLIPFALGKYKLSELEKLDAVAMLLSLVPWEMHARLEKQAPEKMEVPSGSMIQLEYFMDGRSPVMEVRLQEMFGLAETPSVNEGRTPVLLHLLSPGYKPVQVTQDLKNFWRATYHEVRKELRMRYPKHSWPEDPWTAPAVRGAKRKR